jgi:hypothetical protein
MRALYERLGGETTRPRCRVRLLAAALDASCELEEGPCPNCGSTTVAGDDAGIPRRSTAMEPGVRYPADPRKVEEIIA